MFLRDFLLEAFGGLGWGFGFADAEAVCDSVDVCVDRECWFFEYLCQDDFCGFFSYSREGCEFFECIGDLLY